MTAQPADPLDVEEPTEWHKDRKLARHGYPDLAYLPRGRCAWNATLAAYAFSVRRRVAARARSRQAGLADLNLWAAMHACPPSARYLQYGEDGLVLWHGTSAARAERIREHGLFHKRGVWSATDPRIAHGYARGRSRLYGAGSAMVCLLIRRSEWEGRATVEHDDILRFHEHVPPECVEYVLWRDRIEFVGERRAARPKPWGAARFKRSGGRWVPRSRPPVRLDRDHAYRSLEEWLELSVRRIVRVLGRAAAVEVFSSLYATIDPWDALEHRQVLAALERLCGEPKSSPGGYRLFSPPAPGGTGV
jgi:hypothetical protein